MIYNVFVTSLWKTPSKNEWETDICERCCILSWIHGQKFTFASKRLHFAAFKNSMCLCKSIHILGCCQIRWTILCIIFTLKRPCGSGHTLTPHRWVQQWHFMHNSTLIEECYPLITDWKQYFCYRIKQHTPFFVFLVSCSRKHHLVSAIHPVFSSSLTRDSHDVLAFC